MTVRDITVFDLDDLARESTAEPFRFRFGGVTFELPPTMDFRIIGALNDGRVDRAFRRMFNSEQWEQLETIEAVLDLNGMMELLKAYAAHSGAALGESAASTTSSPPTVTP
jgi:hypothetical protein